jgi:hypothetical protein
MTIPVIEPGEVLGPFSIQIPRAAVARFLWCERTTRWERLLWRLDIRRDRLCPRLREVLRDAGYSPEEYA